MSDVIINSIQFNIDRTLLCISQNIGCSFYDPITLKKLFNFDEHINEQIGNNLFCNALVNCQIIAYIHNENNFNHLNLIFFDIKLRKKVAILITKINIKYFIFTKNIIIVLLENNKILIYQTKNFALINIIDSILNCNIKYLDNLKFYEKNVKINFILYYLNNNDFIEIILYLYLNKKLYYKKKKFNFYLNTDKISNFEIIKEHLIVMSHYESKLHIYNIIQNHSLEYCIIIGNFPYQITNINYDNKNKYISLITNNKYLKIYKLSEQSKNCLCYRNNDNEIDFSEKRNLINSLIHKSGIFRSNIYCKIKINYSIEDINNNKSLMIFDKYNKNIIYLYQLNGKVKKIKFNRKEKEDIKIIKEFNII